jgi:DNA-3-methyladenine glycosylase
MFGPAGTAYVYFIYGMHWCFNVVTEREGYPAAILVRALEPLEGLETMRRRRRVANDYLLCSGPARLCEALGITGALNGAPLTGPRILMRPPVRRPARPPVVTPRIGIRAAADWPLRYAEAGSPWTSRPAPQGGAGRDKRATSAPGR